MNEWKTLLAYLADHYGYKGSAKIDDVKKFAADNGLELALASGKSLPDAYAAFKTVKITADAGEDVQVVTEDEKADDEPEKMEEEGEEDKAAAKSTVQKQRSRVLQATMTSAASFGNMADRKAYDRRVAQKHTMIGDKAPAFNSADDAEAFGAWFKMRLASLYPSELGHTVKAYDRDVVKSYFGQKASTSATLTGGGALVPTEFMSTLIELFERYGVFRRVAKVIQMNREFAEIPKRLNEVEIYSPGQNNAITEDDVEYGTVELTIRIMLGLSRHPMSLIEDSAINMADVVANAFATAHAKKEDFCGFLGDGTANAFGIRGVIPALLSLDATPGNIAGVVNAGAAWTNLTLANFSEVVGRTPEFAGDGAGEAWVVSKPFYRTVMEPLILAAGGTLTTDIINGQYVRNFLGHPVYVSQIMPRVTANNTVCALFGNFQQSTYLGDRKQFEIVTSEDRFFDQDQFAIKSRSRVGITVHSLGNASATAADRVAGSIVALRTTA